LPVFPEIEGLTIMEELSQGGMGVVYRARQHDVARDVALKMLLPAMSRKRDFRERFRIEIQALTELDHPGILPLYQVGEADGIPWFTMKLAGKGSLADRLKQAKTSSRSKYTPREAAQMIRSMALALEFAHSRGVLHRDVKPANILFDSTGETPFLADFGLAKLLDGESDMTRTAAILGTPWYMAPEIAQNGGRGATVGSDVYSLGAVLYEVLTGRPPFPVTGLPALLRAIMEEPPPRPSAIVSSIPRDLELICLTCLEKDPRQRYSGAAALAGDLDRWLDGEPIQARRVGGFVRMIAWTRRRPALAALAAALIVSLAAGGTGLALTNRRLSAALKDVSESKTRLSRQNAFLTGELSDSMVKIGRLEMLVQTFTRVDELNQPVDYESRLLQAKLYTRWASVERMQARVGAAVERLRKVLQEVGTLSRERPGDGEAFGLLQEVRCQLAGMLADTAPIGQAHALIEEARTDLQRAELPVVQDERLRLLAEIKRVQVAVVTQFGAERASPGLAMEVVSSCRQWHERAPSDSIRTLALIRSLITAGVAFKETKPAGAEAKNLFEEARNLSLALCSAGTYAPADARFELAQSTGWLGLALRSLNQSRAALAALEEDREIMAGLVAGDGLNWYWRYKLSDADYQLYRYWEDAGDPGRAKIHFEHRVKAMEDLVRLAPEVREWKLALINDKAAIAGNLIKADPPAARRLFEETIRMGLDVLKKQPQSRFEQDGWRRLVYNAAEGLSAVGRTEDAIALWFMAVRAATEEAEGSPEAAPWWMWTVGAAHRRLADIYEAGKGSPDSSQEKKTRCALSELEHNRAAFELRGGLLKARWVRAVENPGETLNAFNHTLQNLTELKRPGEALEMAERGVRLYGECRDVAGATRRWAKAIRQVIENSLAEEVQSAHARRVAAMAVAELYPPALRGGLTGEDQTEWKLLESLAGGPPPALLP
jgi:tetratricopeptide (TPR) repeat protein